MYGKSKEPLEIHSCEPLDVYVIPCRLIHCTIDCAILTEEIINDLLRFHMKHYHFVQDCTFMAQFFFSS